MNEIFMIVFDIIEKHFGDILAAVMALSLCSMVGSWAFLKIKEKR